MKNSKEFFDEQMGGKKCAYMTGEKRFEEKPRRPKIYRAADLVIYALAIGLMGAMVWKTLTGGR